MTDALPAADPQSGHSAFYRCEEREGCGLRFPVSKGDPFWMRCPRCGGAVCQVATVTKTATPTLSTDQAALPTTLSATLPTSQVHLLLDNWRSLFNVGAAFRTADGAGLRHLYLCGITATPANQRKLAKTALGAERTVAWSYHADAVRLATVLKDEGAALWVLERGESSVSLFDINLRLGEPPIVLAAGNEVAGVDPGLLEMADRVIHLPMTGSKDSLNVAVAVSVASYWLRAHEIAAVTAASEF